jgi:hypothetical protein
LEYWHPTNAEPDEAIVFSQVTEIAVDLPEQALYNGLTINGYKGNRFTPCRISPVMGFGTHGGYNNNLWITDPPLRHGVT